MKRAEESAFETYPDYSPDGKICKSRDMERTFFVRGYRKAEKDIIALIESRLSELLGDAQPTPILRYELRDLIKKIKEDKK